ncbi:flavodoxin [Chania multitudinisentens RB-25]|uniref:Flavodoxin n=1 Tax=Chania multitudinisentens RB-25 TaxID=1441930 RepID=W0L4H2_9GAMM|nr:flavodoxin [Chania multitudinisentens]AHG18606.1 flavodoxin [Chania multitudinisentens RB-25]
MAKKSYGLTRREILKSSVLLPLLASSNSFSSPSNGYFLPSDKKVLVAYFSRSGNTRVIAGQLHRALNTALFEIQPAKPYPEDYEETVAQVRQETGTNFEPPLLSQVPNIAAYDTLFLGFPIWGTTLPPVIRTFLSSHDLSGKTLIPFITHGGYGVGSSLKVLASYAPHVNLVKGFVKRADSERETLTQLTQWLSESELKI